MINLRAKFLTLTMMVLCASILSSHAWALNINDVRFGAHPDKIRMVIEIDKITDFRTFVLSTPYRLVVDFPTFEWKAGQVDRPDQSMVIDIRQGRLNPSTSRIVFDLKHPVLVQNAFLLPEGNGKPNRIVVDYRRVTQEDFNFRKDSIHGTLTTSIHESKETPNASPKQNSPFSKNNAELTKIIEGIPLPPPNSQRPTKTANKITKPLIVIDPGHGGQDPGSHSRNKIYEKNIVLALSKELKKQLLETGNYRVLLTRETDKYIRLKDRVKFARDHEADLFISIHADSIHKSNVRGSSIYTISKKASDAQTAKLAEKENQSDLMAGLDISIEDEQVAFILGDFLMNDNMNQSKFFANTLVRSLKTHSIRTLENPHRYAGFAVLKAPDIPSVLIEAGFMSNASEANLLNQHSHRKKVAKAILNGINQYFVYSSQVANN